MSFDDDKEWHQANAAAEAERPLHDRIAELEAALREIRDVEIEDGDREEALGKCQEIARAILDKRILSLSPGPVSLTPRI